MNIGVLAGVVIELVGKSAISLTRTFRPAAILRTVLHVVFARAPSIRTVTVMCEACATSSCVSRRACLNWRIARASPASSLGAWLRPWGARRHKAVALGARWWQTDSVSAHVRLTGE